MVCSSQGLQQSFRLLEIYRVKALGKPLVDWRKQCKPRQSMTLLVNAWWSLANAPDVGFTRGISLILLGFKHRARGRYSEHFGINQQSHNYRYTSAEIN
jgi:hypothetical protein